MVQAAGISGIDSSNHIQISINIQSELERASKEPNYDEKRKIYESAFQALKGYDGKDESSLNKLLYTLIESYAMGTCYGQESAVDLQDEEEGYRRSAALLEMNVLLQLHELGLSHLTPDWQVASLADLVSQLGFAKDQNSKYFEPCVDAFKIDAKTLAIAAEKEQCSISLGKTLIGLSYSTQNISHLMTSQYCDFHKKINELTEAVIGGESQEAQELLEDYRYNRAEFMVSQVSPDDHKALANCYEPVLELTRKVFEGQPLKRDSRLAQVKNKQAILLCHSGLVLKAEPHFREAFNIRKELIGKFDTDKENFDQRFLLCNIRTGLIACSLAKSDIVEAELHAKELQGFLQELKERSNAHAYSNNYGNSIRKVAMAKSLLADKS